MTGVSGCVAFMSVIAIYVGSITSGWIHFVLTGLGISGIVWFGQTVTPPSRFVRFSNLSKMIVAYC